MPVTGRWKLPRHPLCADCRRASSSCTVFETRYTYPQQIVIRTAADLIQNRSARVCKMYPARATVPCRICKR